MTHRDVAAAIAVKQAELLAKVNAADPPAPDDPHVVKQAKAELTVERTLEEMRRLAFSDVRRFFDGPNLKPISELSDEDAACVASLEVVIKNAAAGDGHTDTVHKIKHWDKVRALEMLGKYFGVLREHVDVTVSVDVLHRLDAWKQRHLHARE